MKTLITRPKADALELKKRLGQAGFEGVLCPVSEIIISQDIPQIGDIDALVFTSANAATALGLFLSDNDPIFEKTVYAVGEKTAQTLENIGFINCKTADGDVPSLLELIGEADHQGETWAYLSGDPVKQDLTGPFKEQGITLERHILYSAQACENLPQDAKTSLQNGSCDSVLFYSPRAVTLFKSLVEQEGLGNEAAQLRAICLSATIGDEARAQGFQEIWVAKDTNTDALIQALVTAAQNGGDMMEDEIVEQLQNDGQSKEKPPIVKWLPWALLLVALIFIAGLFSASKIPFLAPEPKPVATQAASSGVNDALSTLVQRMNDIQNRIQLLEKRSDPDIAPLVARLDVLESVKPADNGESIDLKPLLDKLQQLELRLRTYENRTVEDGEEPLPLVPVIDDALLARLDALELQMASVAAGDRGAQGLQLVALATLKDQITSGVAYENTLAELEGQLGTRTAHFDVLAEYASTGVATDHQLVESFNILTTDLLRLAKTPENADWWDRFSARVQTIVTVRKTGDVDGHTAEALVSRLESHVHGNRWAEALPVLESFPRHVLDDDVIKKWRDDAEARQAVDQAVAQLSALMHADKAQN